VPPHKKAAAAGPVTVEDLRHEGTRGNIPTGELASSASEEVAPRVRYPRDPSLTCSGCGGERTTRTPRTSRSRPCRSTCSSSTTEDIACWSSDTDRDEDSFFVCRAYSTGADEPYATLPRALRAEVDEDAWVGLYRTRPRPFPVPSPGRIAVRVVNHYGDEVLQVYEV
jgi:hypothetical protein